MGAWDFEIPYDTGDGGAHLADDNRKGLIRALRCLVQDLDEIKAKFDAHKHSFDGSQAADSISETPVTGATTGSATGGAATSISIGTTVQPGTDEKLA